MRIFVYHPGHTEYVINIVNELSKHVEVINQPDPSCDAFISLQMGHHAELIHLKRSFPHVKFITYVWDAYEWIWDHAGGYDWHGYGELCKVSDEVWTPSSGQCKRVQQHWGVNNYFAIPAYARLFDYDDVKDEEYVCDPLRLVPDKHEGWISKACEELDIPYRHGGRGRGQIGLSWEEYQKFLAHSSFIVCPWWEMSTGGMSLLEGYNLGKEVLLCNSPYIGGKDYFGDRANYFEPNYESLKESIKKLWHSSGKPSHSLEDKKRWCQANFSLNSIATNIHNRLLHLCKS